MKDRPELDALLSASKAKVDAMSPQELEAMLVEQRKSWVRSIVDWPKPKFKWVNGVKVYESFEDYCND